MEEEGWRGERGGGGERREGVEWEGGNEEKWSGEDEKEWWGIQERKKINKQNRHMLLFLFLFVKNKLKQIQSFTINVISILLKPRANSWCLMSLESSFQYFMCVLELCTKIFVYSWIFVCLFGCSWNLVHYFFNVLGFLHRVLCPFLNSWISVHHFVSVLELFYTLKLTFVFMSVFPCTFLDFIHYFMYIFEFYIFLH